MISTRLSPGVRGIGVLLLFWGTDVLAGSIACMNRGGDALPVDAYHVSPASAYQLQELLDLHGRIRLDPGGDYRKATGIRIRSGQALFGAAGTRMGRLVVEPGTSGAVVSGVIPDSLEFPPSRVPTTGNCFERFAARVTVQTPLVLANAVIEGNLFLDVGRVVIDTRAGGRVTNNRFIRTLVHGEAPAIQIQGRDRSSRDRNVFLWANILGPVGDGIVVERQSEMNFVGFDAENWNQHHQARHPAMMTVVGSGTVRAFMAHGGDPKPDPGQYMDIDAERFDLLGMRLIRAAQPAIVLRGNMVAFRDVLSTDAGIQDDRPGNFRFVAYPGGGDHVFFQARDVEFLDRATRESARTLLLPPRQVATSPWDPPVFQELTPDPAGKQWNSRRAGAEDSRETIQRRIDAEGIAVLPAGVFYLSGPLHLRNGQGIVGAGAGRTALVAKSSDMDLITGDDHLPDKQVTTLSLIDLTLQGGRAGIRHDEHGSGRGAQYNLMHISHVVIRDMAEAGVVISGIYGWDNNLIDNVTFRDMPVGVLQVPNPQYVSAQVSGDVAGMNYLDKNVFYRCRFDHVGRGMELVAKRANGLNACIECRFSDNERGAMRLVNNLSTIVANSDFDDNGGDPVIESNFPVGVVGSRFTAGLRTRSFLDSDSICEGCVFSGGGARKATVARGKSRVVLMNTTGRGVDIGADASGLLLDTVLRGGRRAPARMLLLSAGREAAILDGTAVPAPELLVDWAD